MKGVPVKLYGKMCMQCFPGIVIFGYTSFHTLKGSDNFLYNFELFFGKVQIPFNHDVVLLKALLTHSQNGIAIVPLTLESVTTYNPK